MADGLTLRIDPVDTLMFRDGRPFNQSDEGAAEASSVFPPHPPTIVGALRAALWRHLGSWDREKLGDGTNWQSSGNILGPLRFSSLTVIYDGGCVFPSPLHLLRDQDNKTIRLCPGEELDCDLGPKKRLPVPEIAGKGLKPIDDSWLTAAGMKSVLSGTKPGQEDWIRKDSIWQSETRVGIGIDRESRRTDKVIGKGGQLYTATHIRMTEKAHLAVHLSGWQDGPAPFDTDIPLLVPLAGEHRMARISIAKDELALPSVPKRLFNKGEKRFYFAYLMSPCVFNSLEELALALRGKIISACLGKSQKIGGWDSEIRQPIPLRRGLPPGSVLFLESDVSEQESDGSEQEILSLHGSHIGVGAEWGFGQILIGTWQDTD